MAFISSSVINRIRCQGMKFGFRNLPSGVTPVLSVLIKSDSDQLPNAPPDVRLAESGLPATIKTRAPPRFWP